MCVHVKKWRKDAQLEWPEPASGTQAIPTSGEARGRSTTQSFPDTRKSGVSRGDSADPGRGNFLDSDRTQVLTDRPEALTDRTEVLTNSPSPAKSTEVPAGGSRAVAERDRTAGLRDPWDPVGGPAGDPVGETALSHDPYEVTVQLDAVSVQDARLRKADGEPGGGSEGSDGPVFVDESGRRSRRFRRLGIAVGIACAVYAVVIVATLLSGSSDAPWLPVPGQKNEKPAGQVEPTSRPDKSAVPSGAAVLPGVTTPTASNGTTPSPGASSVSRGVSADPTKPAASTTAGAKPTKQPTSKPTAGLVEPHPSTPAAGTTKPADPTPTPTATTATPTEPPVDGGGNAPVANGAASPLPLADGPATPLASLAPSPENTV